MFQIYNPMAWTPKLMWLFVNSKFCIKSSLVLVRYDPDKPEFLKTNWIVEGMGWIIMQLAKDKAS